MDKQCFYFDIILADREISFGQRDVDYPYDDDLEIDLDSQRIKISLV